MPREQELDRAIGLPRATAMEAARFLAISPRKLWELTNCREVPAIRIGRALRYPTDELRNWVAARRGR